MRRNRISSGADWESKFGHSRAIQAGSHVHISGTTTTDEAGNVVGNGDPYEQTKCVLQNIERALNETDADLPLATPARGAGPHATEAVALLGDDTRLAILVTL